MGPGNYAKRGGRGGKVYASQRLPSPVATRRTGLGLGKGIAHRRHRKLVPKDTIMGITKGDIRRLARRGGVKRISAPVYDYARSALRDFLRDVLGDCFIFVEHARRNTILVTDVIYALRRRGKPIYGFEPVSGNFQRR